MSLHSSLKTQGNLQTVRTVMTRAERIEKLIEDGKFDREKDGALKLPKTKVVQK